MLGFATIVVQVRHIQGDPLEDPPFSMPLSYFQQEISSHSCAAASQYSHCSPRRPRKNHTR